MVVHKDALNTLAGAETRDLAEVIQRQVSQLTRQGSGHSLGHGPHVLRAISLFLASQRLGNGEITKEQACAAACIDTKSLNTALTTVGRLLPASSSPSKRKTTFHCLCKQYLSREDAWVPMAETQAELVRKGVQVTSTLMQTAIFYWVCTRVFKVEIPDLRGNIQLTQWSNTQRILEKYCNTMVEDLVQKANAAETSRRTRSQQMTPEKGIQKKLSDLSNASQESVILFTPTKSKIQGMKRKASSVQIEDEPSSKRLKGSGYAPSDSGHDLATHTPKAKRGNAAAGPVSLRRKTPQLGDQEDNEEVSTESIIVRNIGPQKDRDAREAQRPSGTIIDCTPRKPASSQAMLPVDVFNTTPMTSTGTSNTSSPNTPCTLNTRPRAYHLAFNAKKFSSSLPEEEEVPRRRRRNLRAAFLNPSAYGWNPSSSAIEKLEHGRRLEARLIKQFGDPWNTW